jgi:hypothetical protein
LPVRRLVSLPPAGQVCSVVPRRPRIKRFIELALVLRIHVKINDSARRSRAQHSSVRRAGRYDTSPVTFLRRSTHMIGYRECNTEKCMGCTFGNVKSLKSFLCVSPMYCSTDTLPSSDSTCDFCNARYDTSNLLCGLIGRRLWPLRCAFRPFLFSTLPNVAGRPDSIAQLKLCVVPTQNDKASSALKVPCLVWVLVRLSMRFPKS